MNRESQLKKLLKRMLSLLHLGFGVVRPRACRCTPLLSTLTHQHVRIQWLGISIKLSWEFNLIYIRACYNEVLYLHSQWKRRRKLRVWAKRCIVPVSLGGMEAGTAVMHIAGCTARKERSESDHNFQERDIVWIRSVMVVDHCTSILYYKSVMKD